MANAGSSYDSIDAVVSDVTREINNLNKLVAQYIAATIHHELIVAYDSMIEDFYKYKPHRYHRHDNQQGINLYRMLTDHQNHIGSSDDIFDFGRGSEGKSYFHPGGFNAGITLNPGKLNNNPPYRWHSPAEVADFIINKGIRFPIDFPEMKFVSHYKGDKYKTSDGTIYDNLCELRDQMASDEGLQQKALDYAFEVGKFKFLSK